MVRLTASVLIAALIIPPAWAATDKAADPEAQYRACMDQVASSPGKALETAITWKKKGGGDPAAHCEAAAEMALGHFTQGAQQLEAMAREGGGERPRLLQASLWAQAAYAWLSGDQPAKAQAAASESLDLFPHDAGVLVLRAQAQAAQGHLKEATADLDAALKVDPQRVDALVFRASALRQQGALQPAADDLAKALTIDPAQPEALLERGIVRRLQGDEKGARDDWEKLIAAYPQSAAAESAKANLERDGTLGAGPPPE